jgi:hypothetical protein
LIAGPSTCHKAYLNDPTPSVGCGKEVWSRYGRKSGGGKVSNAVAQTITGRFGSLAGSLRDGAEERGSDPLPPRSQAASETFLLLLCTGGLAKCRVPLRKTTTALVSSPGTRSKNISRWPQPRTKSLFDESLLHHRLRLSQQEFNRRFVKVHSRYHSQIADGRRAKPCRGRKRKGIQLGSP